MKPRKALKMRPIVSACRFGKHWRARDIGASPKYRIVFLASDHQLLINAPTGEVEQHSKWTQRWMNFARRLS